jgi:release factor glutamine methyltransferase
MVTLGQFLERATAQLEASDISSARLDVLILLEDQLLKDRSWILAHQDLQLSAAQLKRLDKQISRRSQHEPLAYIRGFSEFYGRRFKVNKHVLEPRPESETMVELLKKLALPRSPKIADVGTGTGCLGITAALEIHPSIVDLYDIDSGALAVARHNEHMHELNLEVHKRDLLNRPVRTGYDVILANLPYVPTSWKINEAAKAEPKIAIFGGKDGLDVYRRLFQQLGTLSQKPKYILTESLPPQQIGLEKIAKAHGFKQLKSKDFIQVFTTS